VKAIDLCRFTTASPPLPMKTWGVISAAYVLPDGTTMPTPAGDAGAVETNFGLGFGLLGPSFGTSNATQHGVRMLGLSSGSARQPTDPGYRTCQASTRVIRPGRRRGSLRRRRPARASRSDSHTMAPR
jgi:hypothetical protein